MFELLVSVLGIYIFIVIGFLAKWRFKERLDEQSINLLSIYFLQVFLTLWGLLKRPIDASLLAAPVIYFVIVVITLLLSYLLTKRLFSDAKERSVGFVAAVIGNTGNLGIPLNIAIFGEQSIPYTTIVNLANVFIVYTIGAYAYSRGSFSVKESLRNIVKLPILWAALVAIILNLLGYEPSATVDKTLMMGAYASMVVQLMLFGIYLYGVKIATINKTLITWVVSVKFVLLPAAAFVVLSFVTMDAMVKGILFLELTMPLAVANVNLSSLYECRPRDVTALVLVTSVLFLALVFVAIDIVNYF